MQRISTVLSKKAEGSFFRVQLDSSGCGDFSYEFMIETEVEDEDMFVSPSPLLSSSALKDEEERLKETKSLVQKNGKSLVVVDPQSLKVLKGSVVDFSSSTIGEKFVIRSIPNIVSKCGCEKSFSVDPKRSHS